MFLILSKFLGFFLQPSTLLFILLLVGCGLQATRFGRTGKRILVFSALCLVILGYSPFGRLLLLPLENRFAQPPAQFTGPAPTGIVVLGGAVQSWIAKTRGLIALNEAGERFAVAAMLARRFPRARLIISNGGQNIIDPSASHGYAEHALMNGLGIANARLVMELHSSNTHENAVFGKEVAQPKPGERWLLVTSAAHMPRAVGCFRRAGFDVEPWPVDYRTAGWSDVRRFFDRPGVGLTYTDLAVKEWIGLVVYWFTGRTSALFPEP